MINILISPSTYIMAVFNSILIYTKNVLPALFPFIFFTKILTTLDSARTLSYALEKPMYKLYHTPPITAYIMVMSFLCGYPIGAKLIDTFYREGYIDSEQAERMTALTSTVGPIFIIGTVGTLLLSNKIYGYIILSSHIIASLIVGFFTRGKLSNINKIEKHNQNLKSEQNILSTSMTDSIISVLCVGGYIALLAILIDFFNNTHIFDIISNLMYKIGVPKILTKGILYGLCEMTLGSSMLSSGYLPTIILLPAVTFITTFGGICIHLQSMSYLKNCGVRYRKFCLIKFLQAIVASIISLLFSMLV